MKNSKKHQNVAVFMMAALGIAVLCFWTLRVGCIFKLLFHVPCPGCGLTRAWLSAFQLDFGAAFCYHPMFWSIPLLLLFIFKDGKLFHSNRVNLTLLIVIGLGFLAAYLVRVIWMLQSGGAYVF